MTLTREHQRCQEICLKGYKIPGQSLCLRHGSDQKALPGTSQPRLTFKINPLASDICVDITPEEPDWDEETFDKVHPPVDLPNETNQHQGRSSQTTSEHCKTTIYFAYDVLEAGIFTIPSTSKHRFNLVKLEILKQSKVDSIEDFKMSSISKRNSVNRYKVNIY